MRAGPPKAAASHSANDRANESASQSVDQSVDHSADPTQAWSRYRDNVARHLIGIARDFQGRVMSHLSDDRGYGGLRPSLGPLLSLVWLEGRPLNAIASQLAISPQACSQLVNLAEGAGYLERKPDPQDGRSKVVGFTPQGRNLVEHAVGIIREIESEYTELVGQTPYRRFTAALSALNKDLGLPTHTDPTPITTTVRSVGVLPMITVRIQQDLMEATAARGHKGLKMSYGQILPLVGPDGARVHEIARIQRVSRQAISATARDLEDLDYLRRDPDSRDRRGVVLQLTDRGVGLIRDSVAALDEVDQSFRDILGDRGFEHLQRVARDLYQSLHLEEEIFEAGIEREATRIAANGRQKGRQKAAGGHDIQQLAAKLRRQLGTRDSARLAALLEPRRKRTAT